MADPVTIGLIAGGTILQAGAQQQEGYALASRGKVQKALNEVAATQVIATGQRKALDEKRQAELMASRAIAVAAAGGATQDIDHLLADISSEGIYRANVAMYEAETESETLKYEGMLAEEAGKEAQRASELGVYSTILSGGSKMAPSIRAK